MAASTTNEKKMSKVTIEGFYKIVDKINDIIYRIWHSTRCKVVHVNRLVKYENQK